MARQNAPTINLYLYDVTENTQRRQVEYVQVRDDQNRLVTHKRLPPRRYRLSYLVTAWTKRPVDEHRLLTALLECFLRYPVLPEDVLSEPLIASDFETLMTVGLPRPEDRQAIDVWSSLGGELKPSLDVVVTAPLVAGGTKDVGPAVFELPRFVLGDGDTEEEVQGNGAAGAGDTLKSTEVPAEVVYGGRIETTKSGKAKVGAKGSFGDGRPGRGFAFTAPPAKVREGRTFDDEADDGDG